MRSGDAAAGPEAASAPPWHWAERAGLVSAPVLAFLLVHFKPVAQNGYLDPFIYTGYIHNFTDLFARYGLTYYSVRFGLILPGQLAAAVFGPVGGYFALRYVLALLAAAALYALVRQVYGRALAAAITLVFLASPFLARAMLWAYPDASGVPYLLGALALFLLEHPRRRLVDAGAGTLAGLALHSNIFIIAPLGAFLGAYAVLWLAWRRGVGALFARAAWFLGAVALVTGLGVGYYWWRVGQWDLFTITFNMVTWLASGGTTNWRTPGAAWLTVHWPVLTPVVLAVLACLARGVRGLRFQEAAMVAGGAATTVFFYGNQFLMSGNSLELHYYYSFALPSVFLLLAVPLGAVAGARHRGIVAAGLVVSALLPWVLYAFGILTFLGWTFAKHVALVAAATALATLVARRRRTSAGWAALASAALGLMFWSCYATPVYASLIARWGRPDGTEAAVYRTAIAFMDRVPRMADRPGHLRFWYSNEPRSNAMQSIQSTYLWGFSKVQGDGLGLPHLEPSELKLIQAPDLAWLMLLAERPEDLTRGLDALREHAVAFTPVERQVVDVGTYRLYMELLKLERE